MKKLLALVLVACMILAVGAFSAFADEGDLVGLSMPTKSLERWNRDGTYLKEQFEAAGYKVELTYSDNDAVKQNNDIANMIADGVKVLVVVAIDADSLSATLASMLSISRMPATRPSTLSSPPVTRLTPTRATSSTVPSIP